MDFWKDKRVLVIGAGGFIGSNLRETLNALGAIVTSTFHFADFIRYENKFYCDLLRKDHCDSIVKDQQIVFMCAAVTHGAAFMKEHPEALIAQNLIMNSQILEASYNAKVNKFVFISSSVVYPDTGNIPAKEDDFYRGEPADIYYGVGWMKRYSEILCRFYAEKIKNPMKCIIIRPSNIFGPNDDFEFDTCHMTAALIRKVVEQHNPLELWGSGEDIRDIVYIDDFIEGILLATEKINSFIPINIAYGAAFSVKNILDMILENEITYMPYIRTDVSKPSMMSKRRIDISLAENILGYRPKVHVREGLRRTLKWYKDNHDNHENSI